MAPRIAFQTFPSPPPSVGGTPILPTALAAAPRRGLGSFTLGEALLGFGIMCGFVIPLALVAVDQVGVTAFRLLTGLGFAPDIIIGTVALLAVAAFFDGGRKARRPRKARHA